MILPDEIVNKEFSRARRGYDIDEVEDYIALLLEKYDTLCRENMELEKNLKSVLTVLENKKKSETSANELLEAAKKESERIIAEAMSKAEKIRNTMVVGQTASEEGELSEIREKIAEGRRQYARLREEIDSFKLKLFDTYSNHITMIEQIPLPDIDWDVSSDKAAEDIVVKKKTNDAEKVRNQIKEAELSEVKVQRAPEIKQVAPAKETVKQAVPVKETAMQAEPVKETAKPVAEVRDTKDDVASSKKFGLNIVREPLTPRSAEGNAAKELKGSQTLEIFPLKFMEWDTDKKRKR